MTAYINTNIIIRFLIGDKNKDLFQKSVEVMNDIENGNIKVIILESVVLECIFVLTKFYNLPKKEVVNDIKRIINLESVINNNKIMLIEALNLFLEKNLDITDCLIYANAKFFEFDILSLDKKLNKLFYS